MYLSALGNPFLEGRKEEKKCFPLFFLSFLLLEPAMNGRKKSRQDMVWKVEIGSGGRRMRRIQPIFLILFFFDLMYVVERKALNSRVWYCTRRKQAQDI